MKKISFVIIGSIDVSNTTDLKEEIEKRGHECAVIDFRDIFFIFENGRLSAKTGSFDLDEADIFLLRSFHKLTNEMKMFVQGSVAGKKIVVDEGIGKRLGDNKVFQLSKLQEENINIPRSWQAFRSDSWEDLIAQMDFPIVVKPLDGCQGKEVVKIETRQAASDFFREKPYGYFAQEYLETDSDLRIFVVGGKVLGGIRRYVLQGDFRTNFSLGSKVEKINVTDEMQSLALQAAHAVGYEVAGVDILEHKGRLYLLEVNPSPQWQGFKKVTGVNPAIYIVDFALEKFNKKDF